MDFVVKGVQVMPEETRYQSWVRLLEILGQLRRGSYTSSELATRLGVSISVVRRDLAWLSSNMEGLSWDRDGREKRYRLGRSEGPRLMYPSALALLLGSRATGVMSESGVGESVAALVAEASSVWGVDADRKIIAISSHFGLSEGQQESFDMLVQALREQRVVELLYAPPKAASPEVHEVMPLSLLFSRSRLYLIVAREGQEGYGLRRLDRIKEVTWARPKRHFAYPPSDSYAPEDLFRYSFGAFLYHSPPEEPVVLRFYGEDALFHRRYDWPVPYEVVCQAPFEVSLEAHIDHSLLHFIMRLGRGVEVVRPASLRARVRAELCKAAAFYDDDITG